MSKEHIIKHTLRLNMDNKQHAFIHGVMAELDLNIHKSRNSFIVDALDFYIENAGKDFTSHGATQPLTTGDIEGLKKEITAAAVSEAKSEILRLMMGAMCSPQQPAPIAWPMTRQGGEAEEQEDDDVIMENALKWFNDD